MPLRLHHPVRTVPGTCGHGVPGPQARQGAQTPDLGQDCKRLDCSSLIRRQKEDTGAPKEPSLLLDGRFQKNLKRAVRVRKSESAAEGGRGAGTGPPEVHAEARARRTERGRAGQSGGGTQGTLP